MKPSTVTPPAGQVDFSQDPNDFAALALGKAEVPPEEKKENTVENPVVPDPNIGHSQDNAEKPADEKKPEIPAAEKKLETNEAKQPEADKKASTATQKLTPEQFAKREADKKIAEMGAEKKRLFMATVEMVKGNPSHLDTVAKYDKAQADAIAKEVYGYDSLEDYRTSVRISELKETNPEAAETEERLFAIEKELKITRSTAQEQLEKSFFASKKIQANPLDTGYQAVMEKVKYLDPTFVKNNYMQALVFAYDATFGPSGTPQKGVVEQAVNEQMSEGGGNAEVTANHVLPSPFSEGQQNFAGLVGAKLI
jgi:hypothetical protein